MVERDLPGSIFGYVVDPITVEQLWDREIGERVSFSLGGRHEKIFGQPLKLENAEILAKSTGEFIHTSPNLRGAVGRLGKSLRVRTGNMEIIIGSVRNQTFDDQPFAVLGANVADYRYIGLKSTQHFRGYFGSRAAEIISTDPPGLHSGDLTVFDYKKIKRPVFPLDENVTY
jgi:microcystin degradation protein MlrC